MPDDRSPSDDEERVRQKAYALWLSEGEPHGRAEAHWAMAREMVAIEDSFESTLLPVTTGDAIEPAIALENQGEFPGLADQGEETPHPPHHAAETAVQGAPPASQKPRRAARR